MMTEWCQEDYRRKQASAMESEQRRQRVAAAVRMSNRITLLVIATLLALVLGLVHAFAQSKAPLTVAQALSLLQAMRNLDGHIVIVKGPDGKDATVMVPWDFGSGALRLRIAKNTVALSEVEQRLETARQSIVREILKGMPNDATGNAPTAIPPGTSQWDELQKQYGEALNAPAAVTLSRIRASELKLDRNEIPVTALSAMAPILDDDVTPKGDGK